MAIIPYQQTPPFMIVNNEKGQPAFEVRWSLIPPDKQPKRTDEMLGTEIMIHSLADPVRIYVPDVWGEGHYEDRGVCGVILHWPRPEYETMHVRHLVDIFFSVYQGQRCLDALEELLNEAAGRKTDLARLIDIHLSHLSGRGFF